MIHVMPWATAAAADCVRRKLKRPDSSFADSLRGGADFDIIGPPILLRFFLFAGGHFLLKRFPVEQAKPIMTPATGDRLVVKGLVDVALADATTEWRDRLPLALGSGSTH